MGEIIIPLPREAECRKCDGSGVIPKGDVDELPCPDCDGSGFALPSPSEEGK